MQHTAVALHAVQRQSPMETGTLQPVEPKRKLNRLNFYFITGAHLLSVATIAYMFIAGVSWNASMGTPGLSWWSVILACIWLVCASMSITAGYHRLFSHSAYKAAWPVRLFYLAFGASGFQNSAIKWAIDHRRHHAKVDTDKDPYNIKRGFWWAHIGWVFFMDPKGTDINEAKDLMADRWVMLQHNYYFRLGGLVGIFVPLGLGFLWGDPIGAMILCGFVRLVLQYHFTFAINSYTHKFGRQPYSLDNTARDSVMAALITMGEGYHNFHHRFQTDYRNGIRWYHYDPTKWFVWTLSKLRLASGLRVTAQAKIDAALAAVVAQKEAASLTFAETAHAIAEKGAQAKQALVEKGAQAKQAIAETSASAQALAHEVMEKGEEALAEVIEKGEEALAPKPRTTP